MKSKSFKVVVSIIATIILVAALYSFIQDAVYFVTKKKATANIVAIIDSGVQQPYKIDISYFNEYLSKTINCVTQLDKSDGNILKSSGVSITPVTYGKYFPKTIYLSDFKNPRITILIFDLMLILFMLIIIWPLKKRNWAKHQKLANRKRLRMRNG